VDNGVQMNIEDVCLIFAYIGHGFITTYAKCKVVLHFVYVLEGFRRYAHARVQALSKVIVFHFERTYFAVLQYFFTVFFCFKFR
jgi:hypothetical protein